MGKITFDKDGNPDMSQAVFSEKSYWRWRIENKLEGSSSMKWDEVPKEYRRLIPKARKRHKVFVDSIMEMVDEANKAVWDSGNST